MAGMCRQVLLRQTHSRHTHLDRHMAARETNAACAGAVRAAVLLSSAMSPNHTGCLVQQRLTLPTMRPPSSPADVCQCQLAAPQTGVHVALSTLPMHSACTALHSPRLAASSVRRPSSEWDYATIAHQAAEPAVT
jgi:hypothetical protein